MQIKAIIFDKDGTLFDFEATWNNWALDVINHYAQGDGATKQRLADTLDFDLQAVCYRPTSPVIAGTNRQAAELIASAVPHENVDDIDLFLARSAAHAPTVPAVPLSPFLAGLRQDGLKLAVMTNDTEHGAIEHLQSAGVKSDFDMIVGADSGYGAKPDADPLLAIAANLGVVPHEVMMVGDSTHDLLAGRRAGMITIGVLTGLADHSTLSDLADYVIDHIGLIPQILSEKLTS